MARIFTLDITRSFIDELAAYIEREHLARGRGLDRVAVVFGGKRPAHFLKRALARRIGAAFVPPCMYTIDELVAEVAGAAGARSARSACRMAGALQDKFDIYTLVRELAPDLLEGRRDFASFLPWAGDILDFIQQLDLEDVPDEALRNIQDSARIGFPVPENINALLQKVLLLRRAFHDRLARDGRTTRGLQYLQAGRNAGQWDASRYDEIIVANFFYFHKSEEALIRHLHGTGKATLIFQGDQTKWPVLDRIARTFAAPLREGPVPTPTTFDLQAYSAFDVHGEAAIARDILKAVPEGDRTVIVLPDAGALGPLLSALPGDMTGLNVSMGYPLQRASLYFLLKDVFRARLSRRDGRYYARDYLAVMTHPLAKAALIPSDPDAARKVAHQLEGILTGRVSGDISGQLFIALEDLEREPAIVDAAGDAAGLLRRAHGLFFTPWDKAVDIGAFATVLEAFLQELTASGALGHYPLNIHLASRMGEICDELKGSSFAGEIFAFDQICRIFEGLMAQEMISFSGTPLQGLQVLGLFETRSLDFDHVIVMDVNEGVLPKIDARASLIPREVMALLGLDRFELEEEIQRYQFMRVISSAKSVHLIYQKNREKEPSRFLEELIWEKQQKAGKLEPYPTLRGGFRVAAAQGGLFLREARKTPKMMEFLKEFTFSASSINAYVANPYTFYMTYVLGLREQEDLLDEPDAAFIGTFLHGFLEEVYKPFEGGPIALDAAFEKKFWSVFERSFAEAFSRRMRSDAFLVRGVMEHKLRAFLEAERERAPGIARLVALEKDITGSVALSAGNVRFKARVDRIEETHGGGIMVLDYKTGMADKLPARPLALSDNPSREEVFRLVGSFQLPLYMHLVAGDLGVPVVNAGLYSLRDAAIEPFFTDKFRPAPAKEALEPYWRALDAMMREILDPEQPFVDDELKNTGMTI